MTSNKQIDHILDEKPNPIKKIIVAVIILILLGTNLYLFKQLQDKSLEIDQTKRSIEVVKHEKEALNTEVDKLEAEILDLRRQNSELDSLVSTKDAELEKKLVYIRKLIASGDGAQLTKAKAEIAGLKEERDTYAAQIEELKAKNAELTGKNAELSTSLGEANTKVETATREKGVLAEKVKLGSQMMAANLKVDAVVFKGSKEKITLKAKSAQKLRICYTVMQNLIVDKGPRNIYIRVLGPDKAVLSSNVENTFVYKDRPTVYSEKKQYQYDNKSIDMCVYWDKTQDQMMKGEYTIELYDDLSMMAKSTILLK